MNERALGTTEQVADYLQLPHKTLAEWRSRGTGPRYFKVGRHVRYKWSEVETWLASQHAEPSIAQRA